ncbi:MAG: SIS domain-containing protein [Longimicrobiales bacterium]|nr:SIS domain-containing protein [Longimicrobiales bacterium]
MSAREAVAPHLAEPHAVTAAVIESMPEAIDQLADRISATVDSGGTLFFCGNGDSAADAQHLAAEYVVRFTSDRRPIAALALTTDQSVLTASGNDFGFTSAFERQVHTLGRKGDLLVMHSTSGDSENLLRAASATREIGVETAALLARDGRRLLGVVDFALVVPTESTARAQEMHLLIGHIVCDIVEEALSG